MFFLTLYQVSDLLSYILHPVILMLVTMAIISGSLPGRYLLALADTAALASGLLPGLLYIYVKTKKGDFGHVHLLLKEERYWALPILLGGIVFSLVLLHWLRAPETLLWIMILSIIEGVSVIVISRFWKISLHALVAAACATLLGAFAPWWAVAGMVIVALIAGVSRLIVRHHTLTQVICGWLYGFGATQLLLALFCF